ncbi:MAG: hypothetical protein KC561_13045 [Myxococcales bacterium]|nr:hypothetical protein [Myxococcales bacterium]
MGSTPNIFAATETDVWILMQVARAKAEHGGHRSVTGWAIPALVTMLVGLTLLGCNYRPATELESGVAAGRYYLPNFTSIAPEPDLDVFAAQALSERLTALGATVGTQEGAGATRLQGTILSVSETPIGSSPGQTLISLSVSAMVEVESPAGQRCDTPAGTGAFQYAVGFDTPQSSSRQYALREATRIAIEELVLDVLLCSEVSSEDGLE